MTAAGPFDVKMTPQPPGEDAILGRFGLYTFDVHATVQF